VWRPCLRVAKRDANHVIKQRVSQHFRASRAELDAAAQSANLLSDRLLPVNGNDKRSDTPASQQHQNRQERS